MKARQRASTTCPRATFEQRKLESVPRHEHGSERDPGGRVWELGELVVDPGLPRVLTAKDHRPPVLQCGRSGATGGLRQVWQANPRRAPGVEAVDAGGGR